MKALTTVSAIGTHFVLGIVRLVEGIIVTIIWIVGIALILGKLAVRRFWNLFAEGYKETWNSYYSQMGKPACAVCNKPKTKQRLVIFHEDLNEWAHADCYHSKLVAMAIHKHNVRIAVPMLALARVGKIPFALPTMLKCLRELHDNPYANNLFLEIATLKRIARRMNAFEAYMMLGGI